MVALVYSTGGTVKTPAIKNTTNMIIEMVEMSPVFLIVLVIIKVIVW